MCNLIYNNVLKQRLFVELLITMWPIHYLNLCMYVVIEVYDMEILDERKLNIPSENGNCRETG